MYIYTLFIVYCLCVCGQCLRKRRGLEMMKMLNQELGGRKRRSLKPLVGIRLSYTRDYCYGSKNHVPCCTEVDITPEMISTINVKKVLFCQLWIDTKSVHRAGVCIKCGTLEQTTESCESNTDASSITPPVTSETTVWSKHHENNSYVHTPPVPSETPHPLRHPSPVRRLIHYATRPQ